MKDAVVKGTINDDVRFREAERLGIDIRSKSQDDISKATFKLNFFADEEEAPLEEVIKVATELKCPSKYEDYELNSSKAASVKISSKIYPLSQEEPTKHYSFEEVVEKCKLFCRKR